MDQEIKGYMNGFAPYGYDLVWPLRHGLNTSGPLKHRLLVRCRGSCLEVALYREDLVIPYSICARLRNAVKVIIQHWKLADGKRLSMG
jgi:hypothetical protein